MDKILESIAQNNGLLGSILVLALISLGYVFFQLMQAKKDHIDDLKAINEARDSREEKITDTLSTIKTIVQNIQNWTNARGK